MKKLIIIFILYTSLVFSSCFADMIPLPSPTLLSIKKDVPAYNIPDSFDDGTIEEFKTLGMSLKDGKIPEVRIDVSGFGGAVSNVVTVLRYLEEARKNGCKIHMHVIGQAISGHAYFVCGGSDFTMEDNTCLFFHAAALEKSWFHGLFSYRSQDMMIPSELDRQYIEQTCVKAGVLDQKDIEAMKEGHDVEIIQQNGVRTKIVTNEDTLYNLQANLESLVTVLTLLVCFTHFYTHLKRRK